MKRASTFVSVSLAALFGAAVIGCDDKTEHKTVDKAPDGTTVTKKETVKSDSDSATIKKEVDVDKPGIDPKGSHVTEKTEIKKD